MRSRADSDIMFAHGGNLTDKLAELRGSMLAEIERIAENVLLNTPVEDFVSRLSSAYTCTPVAVRRDEVSVSEQETSIPIDEVPDGYFRYSEETTHVPGHRYSFHVPFTGDAWLFRMHGSLVSFNLPRATVAENELVFSYSTTSAEDVPRAKQRFEQEMRQLDELVRNSTMLVDQHNAKLATDARVALEKRRARVLQAKNLVAGLGYPLKKRADAVRTYAAPAVRKKIAPSAATPTTSSLAPFRPEPVLVESEYEDILATIESMALVMERSPHAFETLGEEDVRTHFLMLLNGIYEGAATGETFNFNGKTDILIRVDDKNIFIAECKFWRGPAALTATIDQLLGYVSWRDTKTAILVFNRDTAMSTVLGKVGSVLAEHPQHKRLVVQSGDARFRAIFRQPNDADRELTLTVLVFNVP